MVAIRRPDALVPTDSRGSTQGVAGLLVAVATVALGVGYLGTASALRLYDGGLPTWTIGVVASTYYVGAALGCTLCQPVAERLGLDRTLAGAGAMLLLAAVGQIAAETLASWMTVRLLAGFGLSLLFGVTEAWLGARSTPRAGGALLAAYVAVVQCGMLASQLSLAAVDVRSAAGLVLPAAVFAFTLVLLGTTTIGGVGSAPARARARQVLARSPLAIVGAVWSGLIASSLLALAPVAGVESGLTQGELAVVLASLVAGGIVLPLPLGRLSDAVDRRVVLASTGLALAAASALALSRPEASTIELAGLGGVVGGLAASIYPVAVAHANDGLRETERGGASGFLLLAWASGSAAGPTLASLCMQRLGPSGLFAFVAAAALALAALAGHHALRASRGDDPGEPSEPPVPLRQPRARREKRQDGPIGVAERPTASPFWAR